MAKTKSDQKRLKPLALAYVRVSTEEQAKEGASLDAQQSLLADEASRRGWDVEFVVDEGLSAKSVEGRPALVDALERLDRGEADVLLTLRVDRLSRSVSDFAALLSRSRKRKWDLVACDLNIDTSTPHGGLMAHVLASVAEYERQVIGVRTREGMEQRRREGVHLGRRPTLDEALIARIVAAHESGQNMSAIARDLVAAGVPTAHGGQWRASTMKAILASTTAARVRAKSTTA
jgi:DNA invertase Pin-like site-specific DNA recombinase